MAFRFQGNSEKVVGLADTLASDWLSPEEAAELIGVTRQRICQLLRSGEMQGMKLRGRIWLVKRAEALKFSRQPDGAGRPRIGKSRGSQRKSSR